MKTALMTPTVEELERLDVPTLRHMAMVAELAIAKPYFLDRIKVALELKGGAV